MYIHVVEAMYREALRLLVSTFMHGVLGWHMIWLREASGAALAEHAAARDGIKHGNWEILLWA